MVPQVDLAAAKDLPQLTRLLRIQPHVLAEVLANRAAHYESRPLRRSRRGRKPRRVYKVRRPLRDLQRQMKDWLNRKGIRTPVATAFWRNCSPLANASAHTGARFVTVADIRDFFGSVTFSMVKQVLGSTGCGETVAHVLAKLATYEESLPQGARSSPVLSNLACVALDEELSKFAGDRGLAVTRYVDDLTFSGDVRVAPREIRGLLRPHGFVLRPSSYRCFTKGGPQFVTGLCVADHENQVVRLPRSYKRWLRLEAHYVAMHGVERQAALTHRDAPELAFYLKGHLHHAHSVEPRFAEPFLETALPRIHEFIEELRERQREEDEEEDYHWY